MISRIFCIFRKFRQESPVLTFLGTVQMNRFIEGQNEIKTLGTTVQYLRERQISTDISFAIGIKKACLIFRSFEMDDRATRMDERSRLVEEEQEEGGWEGPFFYVDILICVFGIFGLSVFFWSMITPEEIEPVDI